MKGKREKIGMRVVRSSVFALISIVTALWGRLFARTDNKAKTKIDLNGTLGRLFGFVLIVSLVGMMFVGMASANENILINPDFEDGLSGWSSTGGTATYSADTTNPHTGIFSAKGIELNKGNLGRLYQDFTGKLIPSEQYKIGGWIKTENVDGWAVIALDYVNDGGWCPADGYVREVGHVSGTKDWAYYESDWFTLPPMPDDCSMLWFLFDFNAGEGTAWWDDVFLFGPLQQIDLPDLTLSPSDISFSNPNPAVGETVTITATIHNTGNADATDVVVQFFDGDPDNAGTQIGNDQTIAAINAGGTGTAHVDWTATAGSHDIYVIVDPYDDISESNENNNEAHKNCEVDVLPSSLTVTVMNAADKSLPDCGGTIEVPLYDKDYIYIVTESQTYSGGESSVQVQFDNLANEQHFLEVYHTPNSDLKLGEFWGCDEVTVSDSTPKDFVRHTQVVYDVKINGETPYENEIVVNAGEHVHVDITVKNFEAGTSSKNVEVRLILDQDKSSPYDDFDETQGGSIPQNGEKDFSFDCPLEKAGTYYFYIVVRGEYSDEYIVVDQHDWYKAVVASIPNYDAVIFRSSKHSLWCSDIAELLDRHGFTVGSYLDTNFEGENSNVRNFIETLRNDPPRVIIVFGHGTEDGLFFEGFSSKEEAEQRIWELTRPENEGGYGNLRLEVSTKDLITLKYYVCITEEAIQEIVDMFNVNLHSSFIFLGSCNSDNMAEQFYDSGAACAVGFDESVTPHTPFGLDVGEATLRFLENLLGDQSVGHDPWTVEECCNEGNQADGGYRPCSDNFCTGHANFMPHGEIKLIKIRDITPAPETELNVGEEVTFDLTVDYTLVLLDQGLLTLSVIDTTGEHVVDSVEVSAGSGTVSFTHSEVIQGGSPEHDGKFVIAVDLTDPIVGASLAGDSVSYSLTLPDLTFSAPSAGHPEGITISNPSPDVEAVRFEIEVPVYNNGNAPAEDILVRFFEEDPVSGNINVIQDRNIGSIGPDKGKIARIDWTLGDNIRQQGYDIGAVVDPDDDIHESNENNNADSMGTTVTISNIAGVPCYSQNQYGGQTACGPVASASVLGYWDAWENAEGERPYDRLVDGDDVLALVNDLKKAQGWDQEDGVDLLMAWQGLIQVCNVWVYHNTYCFKIDNRLGGPSWFLFTEEIDTYEHPLIYWVDNHPVFDGGHFAPIHGYIEKDDSKWLITVNANGNRICIDWDESYNDRVITIEPRVCSWITMTGLCPIDLSVTDPDGFVIDEQSNEIPGATYTETDINGDGDPDDQIKIPNRKTGYYTITVIPEPDAEPTDTYTLEVSTEGTTTVLAENVTISEIPEEPYIFESNNRMCGDVNCDGKVTMSDVRKVFNRYLDPNYPLDLPWAADVNCDGKVTMSDVRKVFNRYLDPGYELNCC